MLNWKKTTTKIRNKKITYLLLDKACFVFFDNATYFLPLFIFLLAYSRIFKTSVISLITSARVMIFNATFLFFTYDKIGSSSSSVNMVQYCLSLPLITFTSSCLLIIYRFLMRTNTPDLIAECTPTMCWQNQSTTSASC